MIKLTYYSNRKLYNKQYAKSKTGYITISEVTDLVKRGLEISVMDYKTKNDCTQDVLIQCLYHLNNNTMNSARIVSLIRGEQ